MSTPIICLAGPTAAGKSAAAHAIAARWPTEIINVDSAIVYRGMDIGTAKPSRAEQEFVPQHLIDIRDPAERYSAAEFRHDAHCLIHEIRQRGRMPLLCGGTMLYYKALRDGLDDLPPADAAIREEIDQQARQHGWVELHRQLSEFDPVTAQRLAPGDSQRIQRAIEIYRLTNQPMSSLLDRQRSRHHEGSRFITISLEPSDRLALHARIAQRYHQMIEHGLVEEVRTLHQRPDLHPGLPSVRCVGYRQLWDYLDGHVGLDPAIDQAIAATRQLAKRQLTWLRAEPLRQVIDCLAPDAAAQAVDRVSATWGFK